MDGEAPAAALELDVAGAHGEPTTSAIASVADDECALSPLPATVVRTSS